MFVHPITLSITAEGTDTFRIQVRYEIESNEWDIASQQIYNHRCTIEHASLAGGPGKRPVRIELPAEPNLLFGRPDPFVVEIDEIVTRDQLAGNEGNPVVAFDSDKVRAWVYVIQPVASDPVTIAGLERSPGIGGASAA